MKRILRRVKMNLTKQFGKNLLKCVVFIVLFSMLFTSLYIQNIAKNLEKNIIDKFDIYIEIDPNIYYSEVSQEEQKEQTIMYANIIEDIVENTNVSYYDFNVLLEYKSPIKSMSIEEDKYIFYISPKSYSSMYSVSFSYEDYLVNKTDFENNSMIFLHMSKSTRNSSPKDFELGNAQLNKGRMFTNEEIENGTNVCIVPERMTIYTSSYARLVSVGDSITISEVIQDGNGNVIYYQPHTFTVIGTYDIAEGRRIVSDGYSTGELPIYIPEKQFQKIYESVSEKAMEIDSTYYEKNYTRYELSNVLFKVETIQDYRDFLNYLDNYAEEFNSGYKFISTMDDLYPSISNVLSISNTINYISMICLIICIIITIIIILFEIDAARKDIGILLSMGESIKGVILQFVIEMLLIFFLSANVSFVVTHQLGTKVLSTIIKENVIEEVIDENKLDVAIESDEYDEILKPLTIGNSIQSVIFYLIGIGIFQSGLIYILIKQIDPKELMKDE